jgi:arylsulfatase A-like enzyme
MMNSMKAIMVMFDSLNRRYLPPYGDADSRDVYAPNFKRLTERCVTFDNAYIGSMPCIPARREMHTGRLNFLHRSWGPLEPFDDSVPEMLSNADIYTHLVSDHQHYWEDGGATYHQRYSSWECVRGQEGDRWKASIGDWRRYKTQSGNPLHWYDRVNRRYMKTSADQPQSHVFDLGLEFLETNLDEDNWFLQIECFDPHEPFFTMNEYRRMYLKETAGRLDDWPPYAPVTEDDDRVQRTRREYMALLSMCDQSLGRVLDFMDAHDMWKDTMLIVNTDHGYLLGEHGWWAKMLMPFYNEIAHIPLFIWDPVAGARGERRDALVQTIDLAATLLDFFGLPLPRDMRGRPLRETILRNTAVRDACLFGMHAAQINVTDGRYVYMLAPDPARPVYEYTQMPTHIRSRFSPEEMTTAKLKGPFSFTKGTPVMQIKAAEYDPNAHASSDRLAMDGPNAHAIRERYRQRALTMLFDLQNDPKQERPITDEAVEQRMRTLMRTLMEEEDAPVELYERFGLNG